jgi:hypothetical protein
MKIHASRLFPALLLVLVSVNAPVARAGSTTFDGNNNNGFSDNSAVGEGSLTVSDDGSGGVDFSFTLGNSVPWTSMGNGSGGNGENDLIIYLDNGSGTGGIGSSTAGLDDASDGGRSAVSEYTATRDSGGVGQSILNFNGYMDPQYAIDLQSDYGDIFGLTNGGSLNFIDGNGTNAGPSALGANFTISAGVATLDLPTSDFGLSSFSGNTLKFVAIEVSETGYSSNEATESLTGNQGWGKTQTLQGANSFTTAVPEASSVGLLACGAGVMLAWKRNRRAAA